MIFLFIWTFYLCWPDFRDETGHVVDGPGDGAAAHWLELFWQMRTDLQEGYTLQLSLPDILTPPWVFPKHFKKTFQKYLFFFNLMLEAKSAQVVGLLNQKKEIKTSFNVDFLVNHSCVCVYSHDTAYRGPFCPHVGLESWTFMSTRQMKCWSWAFILMTDSCEITFTECVSIRKSIPTGDMRF